VIVLIVVYVATLVAMRLDDDGAVPWIDSLALPAAGARWWQYFTYALLHDPSGFTHVALNALALWVFGCAVEDRLGRAGFLALVVCSAGFAGAIHKLVTPGAGVIGASGAVAAIVGAFWVYFPRANVLFLFLLPIPSFGHIPAWGVVFLYVMLDLVGELASCLGAAHSRVAYAAHLGGYALGIGSALATLATKLVPRGDFDLFRQLQLARRRREARVVARRMSDAPVGAAAPDRAVPPSARDEIEVMLAQNRTLDAARRYARVIEENPLAVLPRELQRKLAMALHEAGEWKACVRAWTLALEAGEPDPFGEIRLLLAMLSWRRENDAAAARRWLSAYRQATMRRGEGDELAAQIEQELPPP